MELAQRSIVSYAIWKEAQKGHKTYLDLRHLGADFLKTRFSGIYASCLTLGFDLTTDLIPVSPAAHYTIGGIKVDLEMKTNLIGLRAIGEVTRTGLHGADRLASNSLLECIVSAFTVAKSLENELQKNKKVDLSAINEPIEVNESGKRLGEYEIRKIFDELKTNMWNFASFNREDKLLKKLIIWIDEVLSKLPNGISSNTSINQTIAFNANSVTFEIANTVSIPTISAGDVVCVVEAMKLFNEIESEFSGTIEKILVEDAQPVEYDQVLFLLNPKG